MDSTEQKTPASPSDSSIWSKAFISLFIANMVMNMGLTMSNSILAKYADSLGAPASQIGMLMSAFAIAALAFKIIAAPAIDTYNKKYLAIFAAVVYATAFFGYSMSTTIPMLMVFRLIQGVGMAFGTAVYMTLISEVLPKDKYSAGIGYFSLGQVIATAIGPSVGLTLVNLMGYKLTYVCNAGILLVSAAFLMLVKYEFKRTKKLKITPGNIIAKEALIPASVMMFLNTGNCVITSFLIVYAGKMDVTTGIGYFFTINALTMLVTRPTVGKLIDKYGLVKIFIPSICCSVFAYFLISVSTTLPMFFLAACLSALGFGACSPAMQTLAMKCVPRSRRGAASSTNYVGQDIGYMIGPSIAGAAAQSLGYVSMWRVMSLPFVIAMVIVFVSRRQITKIEEDFCKREA